MHEMGERNGVVGGGDVTYIYLYYHTRPVSTKEYPIRKLSRAENFRMVDIEINLLLFLISRLSIACSPLVISLKINLPIGIKYIPF